MGVHKWYGVEKKIKKIHDGSPKQKKYKKIDKLHLVVGKDSSLCTQ